MGHPKFTRRKYSTPSHPWESERIQGENELVQQFGLKNKKEIWKANSRLRSMRRQARHLIALGVSENPQVIKERQDQFNRYVQMGLIEPNAQIDDVFTMEVGNLLSRRLQSVVYHRGLATTMKQARQLVTHGHVSMGGRVVRTPSQMVPKPMEETIAYSIYSPLDDEEHPLRRSEQPTEREEPRKAQEAPSKPEKKTPSKAEKEAPAKPEKEPSAKTKAKPAEDRKTMEKESKPKPAAEESAAAEKPAKKEA